MPAYRGEYEDVIRPFVDAMRYKLAASKHRGTRRWQDIPLAELLRMLEAEVVELREAIHSGNTIEMLLEAADIGNFAMMVANVAIARAANGGVTEAKPPMGVEVGLSGAAIATPQVHIKSTCEPSQNGHATGETTPCGHDCITSRAHCMLPGCPNA